MDNSILGIHIAIEDGIRVMTTFLIFLITSGSAVVNLRFWLEVRGVGLAWGWVKLFYSATGLMWAIMTLMSLLNLWGWYYSQGQAPAWLIPSVFVLPGILITVSAMAAGTFMSMNRFHGIIK